MFADWGAIESATAWELAERAVARELGGVRLGDGIQGLLSLPERSVSLVLSDLPSGETRADFDVPPDLDMLWPAIWRALKPNGAAVLMASSLDFACRLVASTPHYRYDLIWEKSVATGFLNASHRPLRSHEFVLVCFQERGTYMPQMVRGKKPIPAYSQGAHGENYGRVRPSKSRAGATDRYPASVLHFASLGTTSKSRRHPQQKPDDLLRHLVRTYSLPGELVVDPYAGSGSTARAAEAEGRRFIAWDSSPRFGVPA
jgi:site-specific DNA-methyltransferase (adenine-specific)